MKRIRMIGLCLVAASAISATGSASAGPGYGFTGDPLRPIEGKYYGDLIHAGRY